MQKMTCSPPSSSSHATIVAPRSRSDWPNSFAFSASTRLKKKTQGERRTHSFAAWTIQNQSCISPSKCILVRHHLYHKMIDQECCCCCYLHLIDFPHPFYKSCLVLPRLSFTQSINAVSQTIKKALIATLGVTNNKFQMITVPVND